MNRGEIIDMVIKHLHEETTPVYWTGDELREYLEDGYLVTARSTMSVMEDYEVEVDQGVRWLRMPARTIAPLMCWRQRFYGGLPGGGGVVRWETVDPTHWSVIAARDARFVDRQGSTTSCFASFGLKEILFDFAPDVVGGTATFKFTLAVIPDMTNDFSSDSDTPKFPPEYHMALVEYVIARATMKEADGPRLGRALRHRKEWLRLSGQLLDWTLRKHHKMRKAMWGEPKRVVQLGFAGLAPPSSTAPLYAPGFAPPSATE